MIDTNVVNFLAQSKEDFVAVLEQLTKEIVDADLRLRQYRIRWRKLTSRLIYLFIFLELAYIAYWYIFTPSGAPPIDSMIHFMIMGAIPLLYGSTMFSYPFKSYYYKQRAYLSLSSITSY